MKLLKQNDFLPSLALLTESGQMIDVLSFKGQPHLLIFLRHLA